MLLSQGSLWLLVSMPLLAAARNCTYPFAINEAVGWQSGDCYRSTWNIISTCIATIVACTWSIQHLNVPDRKDNTVVKTMRRIKWMVVTVFFPELVFIHAIFEFYMASAALVMMKDNGKAVEWPWWFRKRPFAWLPRNREPLLSNDTEKQAEGDASTKWTLLHCYFANMGGLIVTRQKHGPEGITEATECFPVTASQLAGSSLTHPPVTTQEIKDKSKQDWLAKLLAALQIMQLVLSVITRRAQRHPFSQLETVTVTFAVCGILIYCVNFYKPQNVDWAVDISSVVLSPPAETMDAAVKDEPDTAQPASSDERGTMPQAQTAAAAQPVLQYERQWDSLISIVLNRAAPSRGRTQSRILNDNVPLHKFNNHIHPAIYLLGLASGLFGAMHAIAWAFEFPTAAEKLMWKIATAVSTASPMVGLLVVPLTQLTRPAGSPEAFVSNCLALMRLQNARNHVDGPETTQVQLYLEGALKMGAEPQSYCDDDFPQQFYRLLAFLHETRGEQVGETDPRSDEEFVRNLERLCRVMRGDCTKSLQLAAVTNVWPRKPILPHPVNLGIVYTGVFLYGASRLILLGVSLSSLRRMPGSVYAETNWTKYLPKFGAIGG